MNSIFKGAPLHGKGSIKPSTPNYNITTELHAELDDSDSIINAELNDSDSVINVELVQQGKDGASIEFQWKGTELGIRVEGEDEYIYMDLTSGMEIDRDVLIKTLGFEPAQADLLQKHLDDISIHITPEERKKWNDGVDLGNIYSKIEEIANSTVDINEYNQHVEDSFRLMEDLQKDLVVATKELQNSIDELERTKADREKVLQQLDTKSNVGHRHDELYASKQYLDEKILELSRLIPAKISDLEDDIGIVTKEYIDSLNLEEAHKDIEALKDDKADLIYVQTELDKINKQLEDIVSDIEIPGLEAVKADIEMLKDTKVDKEPGKVLSSNDFTDLLYVKLGNIEHDANKYIHPEKHPASIIEENENKKFVSDFEKDYWSNKANKSDIPTKVSQLVNDEGYITKEDLPETSGDIDALAGRVDVVEKTKVNKTEHEITIKKLQIQIDQIDVPTKVSQLQNDSGFDIVEDITTKTKYKIIMDNGVPYFEEI